MSGPPPHAPGAAGWHPQSPITLPYAAHAAAVARDHLRRHVQQLPPAALDDALILTSELVTNAIRHGRPAVTLAVALEPSALTVIVTDLGPDLPPLNPARPPPDSLTGRGLLIVDALAGHWGVTPQPGNRGKAVWFSMQLR